jgi:hypothetical protein
VWVACLLLGVLALTGCPESSEPEPELDVTYTPQAVYCYTDYGEPGSDSPLCSVIPGNIGPDPALDITVAYNGIIGGPPTSFKDDPQTPFDNLSWQTFVALNWTQGEESLPPEEGLQGDGPRVWEGWTRVEELFGDGPVQADCEVPEGLTVFSIASNGKGQPVGQNEEYIQAATADPLIDVSGNWTIYERRVNGIEEAYLKAPDGNAAWTLTTLQGQNNFVAAGGTVDFPAVGSNGEPPTGAIEVKAAWRVLDPADRVTNSERFYLIPAFLKVAPDLVEGGAPICAPVDMALVAIHIIQKNPVTNNALKPEWFWSTFEHVDNAPLAENACDPADPANCGWFNNLNCTAGDTSAPSGYSFYNPSCPTCAVNQAPTPSSSNPQFIWSPQMPYAGSYLGQNQVGTQVSRCWQIYSLTDELNQQWRGQLQAIGSVFQNYMLVGTQWGASITDTPDPKVPSDAVPSYLSNTVVETYLQTLYDPKNPFGTGSCVSCHMAATLPVAPNPSANLSFLPELAQPALVRVKLGPPAVEAEEEAEEAAEGER